MSWPGRAFDKCPGRAERPRALSRGPRDPANPVGARAAAPGDAPSPIRGARVSLEPEVPSGDSDSPPGPSAAQETVTRGPSPHVPFYCRPETYCNRADPGSD